MKIVAGGILMLALLFPPMAQAGSIRASMGCKERFENCKASTPAAKCQILYDEAMKAGGVWGSAEARVKAGLQPGRTFSCYPG